MANSKEIIYIDIDDEITGIIDKVQDSLSSLVVLVLPKRATVLQSSVNMKLLKRSADEVDKDLVLITGEISLLPLAALSKIYVAADLNTKPEIPILENLKLASLSQENTEKDVIDLHQDADVDKPIGQLAKLAATIPIEDGAISNEAESAPLNSPQNVKKHKKNKSLKVPNFNRFRVIFFLVVLLIIILGGGIFYALSIMPRAVIDIKTNASNVSINAPISLSTSATAVNVASGTIPAKQMSYSKTYTATVPTTGQQNNGQVAAGNISISYNCASYSSRNFTSNNVIPSGTGVSYNNLTYITQTAVTVTGVINGGGCQQSNQQASTVLVDAISGGSSYNLASGTSNMQVASFNGYTSADFIATSDGITGGTDSITQVVAQTDINSATTQLNTSNNGAQNALEQKLIQAQLYPLPVTLTTSQPTVTDSAPVGAAATSETVSEVIVYSMYGVSKSDLEAILNSSINSQVSNSSQSILNNGFSNLSFTLGTSPTNLTFSTNAEIGPNITPLGIKKIASGKKSGDVITAIKANPNVTNVSVKLTPFWVTTVPTNFNDVIVNIAKP